MINIAICDDEITICSQLENYILDYANQYSYHINIEIYYSGEELYKYMMKDEQFDIIFLDIELRELNGINIGKKIRNELKNEVVQIVYISAKDTYAMELFEVRPMNFLVKPLKREKINEVIKKALELSSVLLKTFYYKQGHNSKKKEIKDIIYFKSIDKEVMMVLTNGIAYFYSSLEKIYSDLGKYNFFYCHKSYLVNYNHVIDFEYEQLTMSNKEILPIAQPRRKLIRKMQNDIENKEKNYFNKHFEKGKNPTTS